MEREKLSKPAASRYCKTDDMIMPYPQSTTKDIHQTSLCRATGHLQETLT